MLGNSNSKQFSTDIYTYKYKNARANISIEERNAAIRILNAYHCQGFTAHDGKPVVRLSLKSCGCQTGFDGVAMKRALGLLRYHGAIDIDERSDNIVLRCVDTLASLAA